MTYDSAYEALEEIVEQMESDKIQVDELAQNVRRAKELIAFCENKLRVIEVEVDKAVSENPEMPADEKK
jgi:exodeoxyribonuclease VII small subunit